LLRRHQPVYERGIGPTGGEESGERHYDPPGEKAFSGIPTWLVDKGLMLCCAVMEEMTATDRLALINAIANREGTAKQIALWYGYTVHELREFVSAHEDAISLARQAFQTHEREKESLEVVTPMQLDDLWIANKFARLKRYEIVADYLFESIVAGALDAVVLRELRSYLTAAANELGQLLHRGSGDSGTGEVLSVEFEGIDPENFR